MAQEKLCIFCKKCRIEDSRGMGSSWTEAYGQKSLSCSAGKYDEYTTSGIDTLEGYRTFILQAETYPEYESLK